MANESWKNDFLRSLFFVQEVNLMEILRTKMYHSLAFASIGTVKIAALRP